MRNLHGFVIFVYALLWTGCDDASGELNYRSDLVAKPYDPIGYGDWNRPFGYDVPNSPWMNDSISPAIFDPVDTNMSGKPGEVFSRVYYEKRRGNNPPIYQDSCSYPKFKIGKESYSLFSPFERGSNTRLFATGDSKYVVKVLDDNTLRYREMYWREHAAMHQTRHTGVVAIIEPNANFDEMSLECQSRSFVMRKVRGKELFDYPWLYTDQVLQIGKQALKILEKVHDTGIIHGDIHGANFMLESVDDIESSLKLIDFGRSMLYVDPVDQNHKPQRDMMPFSPVQPLNWDLLSINELERRAISRADDYFRLAETLITLCTRELKGYARISPQYVARQKRTRIFSSYTVPQQIQDMYRLAINLGFEDRPNYNILD